MFTDLQVHMHTQKAKNLTISSTTTMNKLYLFASAITLLL